MGITNRSTCMRLGVLLALLVMAASGCKHDASSKSLAILVANGGGIDGSVPAGDHRIYTLRGVQANNEYTIRVTTTDEHLIFNIYTSEAVFENGGAAIVPDHGAYTHISFNPVSSYPTSTFYEAHFTAAPGTSGDYVVVLSSDTPNKNIDYFFYDLRLMSSTVVQPVSLPTTTATITSGALHIYSGGSVTSGSYTISFRSDTTTTTDCPQVFIYQDSKLLLNDLLYSLVLDSTGGFAIFSFSSGTGTQGVYAYPLSSSGATITTLPFVSGLNSSPYIMIKGTTSANYFLTIQP
jgi:hypothetical protein